MAICGYPFCSKYICGWCVFYMRRGINIRVSCCCCCRFCYDSCCPCGSCKREQFTILQGIFSSGRAYLQETAASPAVVLSLYRFVSNVPLHKYEVTHTNRGPLLPLPSSTVSHIGNIKRYIYTKNMQKIHNIQVYMKFCSNIPNVCIHNRFYIYKGVY